MLWFTAFLITLLLTLLGMGLAALAGADLPPVSDALRAVLPGPFAPRPVAIAVTLGAIAGCYALVRVLVQFTFAYTGSARESSPRGGASGVHGRGRQRLGGAAARLFASPTGGWLSTFALLLGLVSAVSFPLVWNGLVHPVAWGLTALYALTVIRTARWPDPIARLTAPTEGADDQDERESPPWGTVEPLEREIPVPATSGGPGRGMKTEPAARRSKRFAHRGAVDYPSGDPPPPTPVPQFGPDPIVAADPAMAATPAPPPPQPAIIRTDPAPAAAAPTSLPNAAATADIKTVGNRSAGRGWRFWSRGKPSPAPDAGTVVTPEASEPDAGQPPAASGDPTLPLGSPAKQPAGGENTTAPTTGPNHPASKSGAG